MFLSELPLVNKVRFGQFWYPSKEIKEVSTKTVRRLISKRVGSDDFYGMHGSATLFRRNDKSFAFLTRHQLGNPDLENLSESFSENFLIPSLRPQLKNLSANFLRFSKDDGEEFKDVLMFELNPTDKDVVKERSYFCSSLLGQGENQGYWYYVGYPNLGSSLVYDNKFTRVVEFKQSVLMRDCVVDVKYVGPDFLKRYTHDTPAHLVDGLSGGAIFGLVKTDIGYEVGLDAVIVRGNGSFLYGINANYLDALLNC